MEEKLTTTPDGRFCPARATLALVGQKWVARIVFELKDGKRRFNELSATVGGCNSRTLRDRLKELEDLDIVRREIVSENPPWVEYELTERGRELAEALQPLTAWGREHLVRPGFSFRGRAGTHRVTIHSLQFRDLQKGQTFARFPLTVSAAEVEAYLESTGESPEAWREHVPPIFIDAIAIATLLSTVEIPKGVMHTGQEHESHRAVRIGETLDLEMRVTAMSERRGAIIAAFEADLLEADATPVTTMKISVMVLPDGVTAS